MEEWEQRKAGDLVVERNEKGHDGLPILSVSIHSGISNGQQSEGELGKYVRRSDDKTKYKCVYPGDIVFNMMRAWQGAIGTSSALGMVSPAYIVAKQKEPIDSKFLNYLLRLPQTIETINNLSYGVTDFRKRLYWDSFAKVQLILPNSLSEQGMISSLLTSLDKSVTLHQR